MSTAYRKITGKVAFTVPEVQLRKELLDLDALRRTQFFCWLICPKKTKMRPTLADTALARENLMLDRLSAAVNAFMKIHKICKPIWLGRKTEEAKQNENHRNNGADSGNLAS